MPEMDDSSMEELKTQGSKKPAKVNNGQFLVETTNTGNTRAQNKFAVEDYDSDISETTSFNVRYKLYTKYETKKIFVSIFTFNYAYLGPI